MRALPLHHIIDIFAWVCSVTPDEAKPRGGRPNKLRDSELLTLIIWNAITEMHSPTLIHLYRWIRDYHLGHGKTVLQLPSYSGFLAQIQRLKSKLQQLLAVTLQSAATLRFVDSTMLPVCRLVRADRHRVAKAVAAFGKNHQGWWYGFKLHVTCNSDRQLCAVTFTGANEADGEAVVDEERLHHFQVGLEATAIDIVHMGWCFECDGHSVSSCVVPDH